MARRRSDPSDIDRLYGLEPVIDVGNGEAAPDSPAGLQLRAVQCPYCGETFDTMVDFSSGSTSYIEDCQVCCQPIEFRLEVDEEGKIGGLQVGRGD